MNKKLMLKISLIVKSFNLIVSILFFIIPSKILFILLWFSLGLSIFITGIELKGDN